MNKTHASTSMKKLRPIIAALLIAAIISGITVVASSAENKNTVLINFQVDAENTGEHLFKVLGELEGRGYTTTVYVTGSFAENNGRIIQEIQDHGHDIAFHGWATGENLTTMNYSMQQKILINAKNSVENYSGQVEGFRPQYYSQNEDTYTILDSLNISYDSGFISGLKFIPGYENYSIPYKVPNHSFYAVPVSSYRTPDKIVYLCDLSASSKFKMNATVWSSILNNKFDESKKNKEPMVVVIHPWITGNETTGYWQAFTTFLDRIENKNIDIVKTSELLDFYIEKDNRNAFIFEGFPSKISLLDLYIKKDDHHAKLYSDVSKCSVPTKIILVRHGETSWNALGILQGNANVPLNENGSAQAQKLADNTYSKTVNSVYSSPLSRAYDTAQAIADVHQLPVKVRGNLREIGVGIYTGYKASQIPSEIRISWSTNPYFAMPSGFSNTTNLLDPSYVEGIYFEGESLDMAADRSWHSITNLAKQHCGENVVTVTHGGIIQMALTQVKGLNITEYKNIPVPTASQTVLEFEPNDSVVLLPNW